MKRDRKGLYSGQSAGKIENVAGMDQDVEFPKIRTLLLKIMELLQFQIV